MNPTSHPPLAWTVNDFCSAMSISRSSFYEMRKSGELRTIVVAGRRLVPHSEVERLLNEKDRS